MTTREENVKKIVEAVEKTSDVGNDEEIKDLDDDEMENVAGGSMKSIMEALSNLK